MRKIGRCNMMMKVTNIHTHTHTHTHTYIHMHKHTHTDAYRTINKKDNIIHIM